MQTGSPKLIAIDHDEYHAKHIGQTSNGQQFFLTTPFQPPVKNDPGAEYVALFLFDQNGKLIEAKIEDFGPRPTCDEQARRQCYETYLAELGDVTFQRIEVQPFSISRFGVDFGFIPFEPEDDEDEWAVELHPGNYMAFYEPWDSGDYDT